MAAGLSPDLTVASGEGRGLRQLHAIDRHGRTAAWTGANCVTWCGSVADHAVSVAGNIRPCAARARPRAGSIPVRKPRSKQTATQAACTSMSRACARPCLLMRPCCCVPARAGGPRR